MGYRALIIKGVNHAIFIMRRKIITTTSYSENLLVKIKPTFSFFSYIRIRIIWDNSVSILYIDKGTCRSAI